MKTIFYLSIFWLFYAYLGYLFLLTIFCRLRKKPVQKDDSFTPSVSMIIAAYNEEKSIREKLVKTLGLDYPLDKLEIIVASDCSSDATDTIVKSFEEKGVRLVRSSQRRGKTAAQNLAVLQARNEILVFSDATTIYEFDALRKLVRSFKDARVACVGGEERFVKSGSQILEEAGFFWKYEKLIRSKESQFNTLIGVSGCIFAIRKEHYENLEEDMIEDFSLPLKLAAKGLRSVYEKEAVGYEHAAVNSEAELNRKVRIVTNGMNVIYKMRDLLNPFKYPLLSFQIISHKIFRWFAPVFLFFLFITNLFSLGEGGAYFFLGISQISFYSMAILGFFLKEKKNWKVFRFIYHFCFINLAAVIGCYRFLKGRKDVVWQPVR